MNLPKYPYYVGDDALEYSFYSKGPRGTIKKSVLYFKINDDPVIYNLGFGDEDLSTGEVSDISISDNQDGYMVLATVANTIIDFSNRYGNHLIYIEGSTPSRTRLYQISIAKLLDEVSVDFDIFGVIGVEVYEFERNINDRAFLVRRK